MDAVKHKEFEIHTNVFTGPLDLLLSLIEKRKLLINDIALAEVTDDFVKYLKERPKLPTAVTTNFVYVAATLLLIKSRSLLPALSLTLEEEQSIEDLEKRLKIYKYFYEYSKMISASYALSPLFLKEDRAAIEPIFAPPQTLSQKSILSAINSVLANLPKKKRTDKVYVAKVVSLEEMVEDLNTRVTKALKMSFNEFAGMGKKEKVYIIVSFLAVLELVKQEIITAQQKTHFNDIELESYAIGTPRYDV